MVEKIGIKGIEAPKEKCDDKKCPFHGNVKIRGRLIQGKVVSDRMDNTVIVSWIRLVKLQKYERYEKKSSKVAAHNPACIEASIGDKVVIGECRPLSKTKKFVVLKVLK